MIKIVSPELLNKVIEKAKNSTRKRLNHNFHDDLADLINRMLNAFEPGTYIQPHKHENPDKREVFIVLRGSLVVVFFNNSGAPTDFVLLIRKKEIMQLKFRRERGILCLHSNRDLSFMK